MSRPEGRVLLALSGANTQQWHDLLAREREVTLTADGPGDPSIAYAIVWKQPPSLLASPRGSAPRTEPGDFRRLSSRRDRCR